MFFFHHTQVSFGSDLSSVFYSFIYSLYVYPTERNTLCDILPSNERSNDVREMVGRGIFLRRTFPMAQVHTHTHTHNEVPRGMGYT